jgi:hypothetical protein
LESSPASCGEDQLHVGELLGMVSIGVQRNRQTFLTRDFQVTTFYHGGKFVLATTYTERAEQAMQILRECGATARGKSRNRADAPVIEQASFEVKRLALHAALPFRGRR